MKQIFEYINSLNDQARYCLLVGVVFAIILLDVFLLVVPQMGSIADINDQIKKLSDDTQQVLVDRVRINPLKKNLKEAQMKFKLLSSRVRLIQEVPALLSTISSIANEYGVRIDQMVPEKNQQEVLSTTNGETYYALPVVIKARCGYHKFGYFLNKLENQDLYFVMKDFIVQGDEKDPKNQLFSLTIKIILVDRTAGQTKSL